MTDEIDWPFEDPKNLAVITTKRIISGTAPILYVFHDAEEESWQFLDSGRVDTESAAVVGLYTMTQLDSALLDLADLPLGWKAWREEKNAPWQRCQES